MGVNSVFSSLTWPHRGSPTANCATPSKSRAGQTQGRFTESAVSAVVVADRARLVQALKGQLGVPSTSLPVHSQCWRTDDALHATKHRVLRWHRWGISPAKPHRDDGLKRDTVGSGRARPSLRRRLRCGCTDRGAYPGRSRCSAKPANDSSASAGGPRVDWGVGTLDWIQDERW
jgi:hypothetical protein